MRNLKMKFENIIPEVKMSEATLTLGQILKKLEPYKIISVNTNSLFRGNLQLLREVRAHYPKRFLIRKDFIMIPRQIQESKQAGADAVLLLRKYLTDEQYWNLIYACRKLNMVHITEVNEDEQFVPGNLIMVNCRDLNTGKVNRRKAIDLCKSYKEKGYNVIMASAADSNYDIIYGIADAVLIGKSFVQDKIEIYNRRNHK